MTLASLVAHDDRERLGALEELATSEPGALYAVRDILLGDDAAAARALAAVFFERGRFEAAVPALTDALYDTHPSVRSAACRALGRTVVSRSAPALLRRIALEDPIWWVRRAAVYALARIERIDAVPVLRAVLDDPFWRVRHAAARILVVLAAGDDAKARTALAGPNTPGSARAKSALAWIGRRLGLLGSTPTTSTTLTMLDEPDVDVLRGRSDVFDPDPAVITARLEQGRPATHAELAFYVGDPHEALRNVAVERLRACRDVRALLAASLWLEEPRIPHATATVVALLDGLGSAEADELLDVALGEPDARPGLAGWALSFVAEGERWEHAALIGRAMEARTPFVRRAATAALGELVLSTDPDVRAKREPALEALESCACEDDDEDARRLAVHALVRSGHPAARARVLAAMRGSFDELPALVRRLLVVAAEGANDSDLLARAADDPDPETRAYALAALHGGGALTEDAVRRARRSEDPWIRGAVLDVSSALEALRDDVDPRLKRTAFERAAREGQAVALAASRIACRDADPWLRAHATERLVRSDDDEDLVLVLELSRDRDPAVRAAAADLVDLGRDLHARLERILLGDPREDVRAAADTWLGRRAPALMESATAPSSPSSPPAPPAPPSRRPTPVPQVACARRALGRRSGIEVSPLVVSGANEPSVASLFRAMDAGCNAFFWEPRYRNLTLFLRATAARRKTRAQPLVIAGTYHASEDRIRQDVERALVRLRRDTIDVLLVFWARSPARLEGEVPRTLERLRREGRVRAVGFSTHDRALATANIGRDPWDVVMVRHSAAHPGAEAELFPRAEAAGVGVLAFSATSYGRLLRTDADDALLRGTPLGSTKYGPRSAGIITAADCYRYALAQPSVAACVSAPRRGRELVENLEVLTRPAFDAPDARLAQLRAHGLLVREASLDFGSHIRRFPALPDRLLDFEEEDGSPADDELQLGG